jgi:hypothetical protein
LLSEPSEVLAVLMTTLAFIFSTAGSGNVYMRAFYSYVPPLLLCFFLPGRHGQLRKNRPLLFW